MKYPLVIALLLGSLCYCHAQTTTVPVPKKGKFYLYWGWNADRFATSDIHFTGLDYDFTLYDVVANDRLDKFSFNRHLNPNYATIPQYNFRVGYFLNDHLNVSFGIDHMKYVMQANQSVKVSGHIAGTNTDYDGTYAYEELVLRPGFLQYEHTDGLNYLNLGLRHLGFLTGTNNIRLNYLGGLEAGILVPRTNVTLFDQERHDEFHLSGYGVSSMLGLQVEFFHSFFIQTEVKASFLNLPDVLTTYSDTDRASQQILFSQFNIVLGTTLWGGCGAK